MKSLVLDLNDLTHSKGFRYSGINNLLRVLHNNEQNMFKYVDNQHDSVNNQNILVGLLQTLSIQKEWTKEYVEIYTKFRSKSIYSAYGVISTNQSGKVSKGIVHFGGVNEFLIGLNPVKSRNGKPLIPLYNTLTDYSYAPSVANQNKSVDSNGDYALIGLDFVSLALGWHTFINDPSNDGLGIHQYLARDVFPEYRLLSNQLAIFNSVYQRVLFNTGYSLLLNPEYTQFTTLSVHGYLEEMLIGLMIYLKRNVFDSELHILVNMINPVTDELGMLLNNDVYSEMHYDNVSWALEASNIQLLSIYYQLALDLNYKPNWTRSEVMKLYPILVNRYNRYITNVGLRDHLLERLESLQILAKNTR